MASVAQTGPLQSQPPHMQADSSSSSSREQVSALSWEGDRMFNIYIYDYCFKRGFEKTARELLLEADLGTDPTPPINAKQGLLFEWWSVFWVLFQAKSGMSNSDDALLYIQHQNAQKAAATQRMQSVAHQPQQQPGAPMGAGTQPLQVPTNPQSHPPQPPIPRMPNGMPQRQPLHYTTNGAMPNGINPVMGGQPAQPGQQQMSRQSGSPMNFVGIGGQPNGHQQPPQGGPQQPAAQTMPFNSMLHGAATQRLLNGQPQQPGQQQQQHQAGRGPFTSPPMAHSPQGGAAGGSLPPQGSQPGQPGQAPMAQLGPSPHITSMNRGMLPPNGGPSTSMGTSVNSGTQGGPVFSGAPLQGPQGQGPNQVAARPPSRSRPTPSPSFSARQTPGGPGGGPQQQGGIGMMGGMVVGGMPGMSGMNFAGMPGGAGAPSPTHEHMINQEIMHIPPHGFHALKQDMGLGDKDIGALNIHEKARILTLWRQRNGSLSAQQQQRKDAPGPGPVPGGMLMPGQFHQPQPQGNQLQQRGGPQQPQSSGAPNRMKRNSTSPGDENDLRNESSPPEPKRMKRSPPEQPAIPPGPYSQHLPVQQPLGAPSSAPPGVPQPPTPKQTPMQVPQGGQPPGGHAGMGQSQITQAQNQFLLMQRQQAMGMSGMNGPGSGGQAGQGHPIQSVMDMMHPGQMQPQQPGHFRPGGPPGPPGPPGGSVGPPPPQFSATPLTRLGQTKPNLVGMMPPPSPGMNGPPKDTGKESKGGQSSQPNGQSHAPGQQGPEASPRNSVIGTAPPTPAASNMPTPGLQPPPGVPPPPGTSVTPAPGSGPQPTQQPPTMPSMLSMPMNMGMSVMNSSDIGMFEPPFMEEFDVFKTEDNINFERDFGEWFTTQAAEPNLDIK